MLWAANCRRLRTGQPHPRPHHAHRRQNPCMAAAAAAAPSAGRLVRSHTPSPSQSGGSRHPRLYATHRGDEPMRQVPIWWAESSGAEYLASRPSRCRRPAKASSTAARALCSLTGGSVTSQSCRLLGTTTRNAPAAASARTANTTPCDPMQRVQQRQERHFVAAIALNRAHSCSHKRMHHNATEYEHSTRAQAAPALTSSKWRRVLLQGL